jgi:hypothetical protein
LRPTQDLQRLGCEGPLVPEAAICLTQTGWSATRPNHSLSSSHGPGPEPAFKSSISKRRSMPREWLWSRDGQRTRLHSVAYRNRSALFMTDAELMHSRPGPMPGLTRLAAASRPAASGRPYRCRLSVIACSGTARRLSRSR